MKMKSEECMKGTHMSLIILSIVKSTNGIPFILQKRRWCSFAVCAVRLSMISPGSIAMSRNSMTGT